MCLKSKKIVYFFMGKSTEHEQGKNVIFNKTAIFSFGWNYPNEFTDRTPVPI